MTSEILKNLTFLILFGDCIPGLISKPLSEMKPKRSSKLCKRILQQKILKLLQIICLASIKKFYNSASFLDVKQFFWRNQIITTKYHTILDFYLENRRFVIKENSKDFPIKPENPQGCALGSFLYNLFTPGFPTNFSTNTAICADDSFFSG